MQYLKKYQLTDIVICAGSLWERITEYFNDGKKWGINIKYSLEKDKLLGTGGALKQAEELLADKFIVLNGDTFLPLDYQDFISTFTKQNHLGMLAAYNNSKFLEPGNIRLNDDQLVTNYNRDKKTKDLNYIDAGVAIYRKKLLELIPAGREVSLEREIYPVLISNQELASYPLSTKFYDIGTAEKLEIFSQYLGA